MASHVAFAHSSPALRSPARVSPRGGAAAPAKLAAPIFDGASEPRARGYGPGFSAALAAVAVGARRVRPSKVQQRRPRLALRAVAKAEPAPPLTGTTLQAALKMRCDTSGAVYAIYWANENGKLVVAGDYVPDARRAALKTKGLNGSFAEESEAFSPDVSGEGPVASVYKTKQPLLIKDIASSNMKRKDLATKYGIRQVCFIGFEAGVLEYGTSEDSCSATWEEMPECPLIPKAALRRGYENLGASYSMFWAKQGDKFKVVADYVTDSRKKSLKAARGDDETFCSKSREIILDAGGDGPVAKASRTGEEVTVYPPFQMQRAALAEEFGIQRIHFVPAEGGVLEYGTPANTYLSGPTLAASLKMRCDTSGAAYALYWQDTDGKATVTGDYVTPARAAALKAKGKTDSFAEASKAYTLDAAGSGPVATVLKTREPLYIQDVATCDFMKRGGLAVELGIKSICLVPVQGGVLEYGTSDGPCSADWTCMEDARQAIMPKAELEKAFDSGATSATFWWKKGEEYVVGASYVLPERVRALKAARGDDKTYASESESVKIPADSLGPVATSARSGKEIILEDPSTDPNFKRADLAKEFNMGNFHFVPCKDGVLEWGKGISK